MLALKYLQKTQDESGWDACLCNCLVRMAKLSRKKIVFASLVMGLFFSGMTLPDLVYYTGISMYRFHGKPLISKPIEKFEQSTLKPALAIALLCTPDHWTYAFVLAHRIRKLTRVDHDILVLTHGNLSRQAVSAFSSIHAVFLNVNTPVPPQVHPLQKSFRASWQKLHLFTLTQYDQILYLDSDIVLLKDISPIFGIRAFASVPMSCNERLDLASINGGLLLIRPNLTQYDELLALATTGGREWLYSEQELLSVYFLWMYPELYVPLSTHFMLSFWALHDQGLLNHDGVIPRFGRHWLFQDKTSMDVLSWIYIVHFVCGRKPWERDPSCWDLLNTNGPKCRLIRMWHEHARDAGII